jgi:trans-aconitate 2-methyltransferase
VSADPAAAARQVAWDPTQYLRFGEHRLRPALELLQRVQHGGPGLVYDLGCGTGNITRIIADRWPGASVVGADSSPDMLAKAAQTPSRIAWEQLDVRRWQAPRPVDVIYSNAMLQWVTGHPSVFPRLVDQLAPGGVLAVQMPLSWSEPSHRLMRQTLAETAPGETALLQQLELKWVADAGDYYDLIMPLVAELDIWETRYYQQLEGADPVLEWVKGTGLRPVLETLKGETLDRFLQSYGARLREAYPRRPDGRTVYPFPRLFIVARR